MKPISLLVLSLILLASAVAEPARMIPKPGESLYFVRVYTPEHLAANPKQIVEKIAIEIQHEAGKGRPEIYIRVLKRGQKNTVYEGGGYWERRTDGSLRFSMEGDAGRGSIEARQGHILLKLRGEDYLVLEPDSKDVPLELSASDPEHQTFRLEPATAAKAKF